MSIFRASDKIATSYLFSALFLCGAFVTTVLFSRGLGHWPAYLQLPFWQRMLLSSFYPLSLFTHRSGLRKPDPISTTFSNSFLCGPFS
jgi:hypothetical protein